MRRLFWMGVGAAGAVWVAQRAKRAMTALPETVTTAVAQQAGQARVRVSGAASEALAAFRAARTERECELVEALLVEPAGGTERRPRTATRTSRAERASADPWDDDPWGPEDDEDD